MCTLLPPAKGVTFAGYVGREASATISSATPSPAPTVQNERLKMNIVVSPAPLWRGGGGEGRLGGAVQKRANP
jgi:hypothetical protein